MSFFEQQLTYIFPLHSLSACQLSHTSETFSWYCSLKFSFFLTLCLSLIDSCLLRKPYYHSDFIKPNAEVYNVAFSVGVKIQQKPNNTSHLFSLSPVFLAALIAHSLYPDIWWAWTLYPFVLYSLSLAFFLICVSGEN